MQSNSDPYSFSKEINEYLISQKYTPQKIQELEAAARDTIKELLEVFINHVDLTTVNKEAVRKFLRNRFFSIWMENSCKKLHIQVNGSHKSIKIIEKDASKVWPFMVQALFNFMQAHSLLQYIINIAYVDGKRDAKQILFE